MSCFLIVGEEPSTVDKIVEVMGRCQNVSALCTKWQKFAEELGLIEAIQDVNLCNSFRCTMENLESLLFHLLFLWKEKNGFRATMHHVCQALACCDVPEIAAELMTEFFNIFKEKIIGRSGMWFPMNLFRLSEIFLIDSVYTGKKSKQNDQIFGLGPIQIANKFVCRERLGRILEQLIAQWNPEQLKIVEGYSFVKLHLDNLARLINVRLYNKDERPIEIIAKMNFTNKGMYILFWFIVARAVLKAEIDSHLSLQMLYKKVFAFTVDGRGDKINGNNLKFKNEFLVYFVDLVVGAWREDGFELYKSKLHLSNDFWLSTFVFVCLKTNAINLLKDLFSYPEILHKLVQNTVHYEGPQLEWRKDLAFEKIKEDSGSVNVVNEDGLSPMMMKSVHVELLKVLFDKTTGANVERVDKQGRNFVHLAADYLSMEQLRKLVTYLIQDKQTSVLAAKDIEQRTPLVISLQKFDSKPDVSTIQLFGEGGVDFNSVDKYGLTPLYYAITRKKDVEVLKALVECGADWRWRKWDNNSTLLHVAAREGTAEQVEYLIDIGCSVNSVDNEGNTPLHIAAGSRIALEGFNLLLKRRRI